MSTPRDKIEAKLGLTGPPLQTVRDSPPAIPDHELIRRIGQGAYGEVWLARNALGTWRAVKIVYRDNFKDARPYEREFAGIRRFEPLSRSNEGFVDILQVGRDDADGWFYYVMELADAAEPHLNGEDGGSKMEDGISASEVQRHSPSSIHNPHDYQPRTLARDLHHRGRLPLEDCLQLGLTLTLALGHLHRHGLIHRDVKPSNIIYVGGVPKLADIGLVTEAAGANTFVGTEGFVPPEGPTSPQADLFALGKVLYEVAMGKDRNEFPEPFTQIGTDRESMALMELSAVLLRACAPDPRKRYATAEEMHADLALLHSGGSVKRRHQFDRQFQIAKQVGAVAITATLLIGAAWIWQQQQTKRMTRLAEEKSSLADANARLANEKDAAARESRRHLLQAQNANGLRAMDENDPAMAALWFSEVLKQAEADPDLERRQRFRLGTLLRHVAKPVGLLQLELPPLGARVNEQMQRIITSGRTEGGGLSTGEFRIWDASSGLSVTSMMLSNIWGNRISPHGRWSLVSNPDGNRLCDILDGMRVVTSLPYGGHGERNAWSQDETKLAMSAYPGREVQIIDIPTGRSLATPLQLRNQVSCLRFDTTGRQLVTGTTLPGAPGKTEPSGQARVWDGSTGEPITDWLPFDEPVNSATFSPDGRALVVLGPQTVSTDSALRRNVVCVMDLLSARLRFPPLPHQDTVLAAAFSPDGCLLATSSADRTVMLWNALTGEAVHPALTHDGWIKILHFSPDGRWLATAEQLQVRIWDVRSGRMVTSALRAGTEVMDLEFTPDGSRLFVTPLVGSIRVWNLADVEPVLPPFPSPSGRLMVSALFSPDGKRLATVEDSINLQIWDTATGRPLGRRLAPTKETSLSQALEGIPASWSADGRWIAALRGDSTVRVWDADNTEREPLAIRHGRPVKAVEFSPVTNHLVTASADNTARVWDAVTGQPLTPPLQHTDAVSLARFSPDGRRIATAAQRTARLWDAATGQPLTPPLSHAKNVGAMAFSPDGAWLATATDADDKAMIWDTRTGQMVVGPLLHFSTVEEVVFSPDGRLLLTASMDHTARVWDARTGQPVTPPLRHAAYVVACAFSPDGSRVVTASHDGTARIWDAQTGEALTRPFKHQKAVNFAAFSPDGQSIVTASFDGTAQIWETPTLDWTPAESKALAQVLAGGFIASSGRVEPLDEPRVEAAWRNVMERLPRNILPTATESIRWHRRRMTVSEHDHDWFAAEFHARRLTALLAGDAAAQSDLDRILARRPPPRDPATPPE